MRFGVLNPIEEVIPSLHCQKGCKRRYQFSTLIGWKRANTGSSQVWSNSPHRVWSLGEFHVIDSH